MPVDILGIARCNANRCKRGFGGSKYAKPRKIVFVPPGMRRQMSMLNLYSPDVLAGILKLLEKIESFEASVHIT